MAVPPVKKNRFKQLKPELLDRLVVEWLNSWRPAVLCNSFVRAHSEHLWTGQTCKGNVELNWQAPSSGWLASQFRRFLFVLETDQATVGYMLAVPPGARFSEEIIAAAIMAYYSKHSLVPTGISQQVMLKWLPKWQASKTSWADSRNCLGNRPEQNSKS